MAGIIKNGILREDSFDARVAAFNLDDFSHKAQRFLDQFRGEAARILQGAQGEAEQIRKKAADEGRLQARKEAERALEAELKRRSEAVLASLEKTAQQLATQRAEWQQHWETYAVKLAAGIAERLVRQELKQDPQITVNWIREALELGGGSAQIQVLLNPADIRTLDPVLEELTSRMSKAAETTIVADETMPLGEVRVQTEHGSLDQRIASQLERLEKELLGE
jgi:flagellar assembly protein FliH